METIYKKLDIQKNGHPCIYMIKNTINNKIYIGSAIGHYRRKGQHYWMLRRNKHFNLHLQSSWNKYSENSFIFQVIEFIDNLNNIEEKEEYWINYYNTLDNNYGYNARVNCKTNLGLKWPLESRRKFSDSKKGKKILHINYIKVAKNNMKKVKALNIKTNEVLYFNSLKEAAIEMKVDPSSISKAVNHIKSKCKGYIWDFVEQSTLKNSVNSGNILIEDNPDPSVMNDNRVVTKEQRLTSEESTNNLDTSAEQPKGWITFIDKWKQDVYKDFKQTYG
jgi:hypothetical protein